MNTLIKWNITLSIFMTFSSCNFENDKNEIVEYNEIKLNCCNEYKFYKRI